MYPHQIRLLGPWKTADGRTVRPPVAISELGAGSIRVTRHFGAPRQLDDWERVWLVPGVTEFIQSTWRLNGAELDWLDPTPHLPRRVYVTSLLRPRNELRVDLHDRAEGDGWFGGAMMMIGCRAHIEKVWCYPRQGRMEFTVDVASECRDDPLELYTKIDGESFHYLGPFHSDGPITQAFRLDEGVLPEESLQVDLVCRSVFWDSVVCKLNDAVDDDDNSDRGH